MFFSRYWAIELEWAISIEEILVPFVKKINEPLKPTTFPLIYFILF